MVIFNVAVVIFNFLAKQIKLIIHFNKYIPFGVKTMKKRKKNDVTETIPLQNPVAKYARQFNKAHVFADKNQYRRHAKHRKQEVSLNAFFRVFKETFCFSVA